MTSSVRHPTSWTRPLAPYPFAEAPEQSGVREKSQVMRFSFLYSGRVRFLCRSEHAPDSARGEHQEDPQPSEDAASEGAVCAGRQDHHVGKRVAASEDACCKVPSRHQTVRKLKHGKTFLLCGAVRRVLWGDCVLGFPFPRPPCPAGGGAFPGCLTGAPTQELAVSLSKVYPGREHRGSQHEVRRSREYRKCSSIPGVERPMLVDAEGSITGFRFLLSNKGCQAETFLSQPSNGVDAGSQTLERRDARASEEAVSDCSATHGGNLTETLACVKA